MRSSKQESVAPPALPPHYEKEHEQMDVDLPLSGLSRISSHFIPDCPPLKYQVESQVRRLKDRLVLCKSLYGLLIITNDYFTADIKVYFYWSEIISCYLTSFKLCQTDNYFPQNENV